jgi:DHA2 family multidrug resistance protein-like MFS transporter
MDVSVATGPARRAGRREWVGLAVLALPTLLLSLDVSVLYLALPHLSADLGAGSTGQLWILDIYSFLLAGFLVTMGTLGDRIGRRRLLLYGAAAFGVASVLAAYATSTEMLIAARALLGVAGATLMPSTMALIRNMFTDPKEMGAGDRGVVQLLHGRHDDRPARPRPRPPHPPKHGYGRRAGGRRYRAAAHHAGR